MQSNRQDTRARSRSGSRERRSGSRENSPRSLASIKAQAIAASASSNDNSNSSFSKNITSSQTLNQSQQQQQSSTTSASNRTNSPLNSARGLSSGISSTGTFSKSAGSGEKRIVTTPEDISIPDNKRRKVEYVPDGKLPIPDGLLPPKSPKNSPRISPKMTTGDFSAAKASFEANLTLEDDDGNQYCIVSCEPLSVERGLVYASVDAESFDKEKLSSGGIYSISAANKEDPETVCKEFIASYDGENCELITRDCEITCQCCSHSEMIEYRFEDPCGEWQLAPVCQEALQGYIDYKFKAWRQQLDNPSCEAEFRRLLQNGLVAKIYDRMLFKTPDGIEDECTHEAMSNGAASGCE